MTRRPLAAATALTAALLLSACTDPSPDPPAPTPTEAESAPEEDTEPQEQVDPQFNDADEAGAVRWLALDRTSVELHEIIQTASAVDQEVQTLSLSLHTTHYDQIDTLEQMLTAWGVLDDDGGSGADGDGGSGGNDGGGDDEGGDDGDAVEGTDAAHQDDDAAGAGEDVVGPEGIQELREADADAAGELYLEQMIALHRERSTICEDILHDGENPDLAALAQETLTSQQHELTHMENLLQAAGSGSDDEGAAEDDSDA